MGVRMNLKVGFGEEFNFDNQALPYASSSSGSFSSDSTANSLPEPFTPTSGRSTPGYRSLSRNHDSVSYPPPGGFELTPPSSTFSGSYPSEMDGEMHRYMDFNSASPSPSRKSSMQTQNIDFDYTPMLHPSFAGVPAHENALGPSNNQSFGHYPFGDQITSPPFPVSAPGYPFDITARDMSSMWAWSGETPVPFFGRENISASTSPAHQHFSTREREDLTPTPPYLANHARRRLNLNRVQQRTSALQKAQHRQGVRIERIAAATFKCNYPNCQKGPFKRQEHLKRHQNTKHAADPAAIITSCPICRKPFNRKDNYRSHLKLHTIKNRPTRRTDYHPEAQALLGEEMNKTKQRSQLKKRDDDFKD
ncbi:hypothetical protein GGS23DRAFT_234056 [Durotheca rogersii]|uniref:uncharacterized protein n=1 Tax=Durotheca rogersii TaxID=419775 RepID=UPI00221F78FB|nr:uncharacterized protein GGS23DRAFT_234056 [Durotheca rogersii]KAI5860355.1 hypothetical protein GGS23DRAFT_234056 [Durotheca rogersii]